MISAGFAEERETSIADECARQDGDFRYGIYAAAAGLLRLVSERGAEPGTAPLVAKRATSKAATVLALLSRDTGATLADLIAATGWLPYTTRAALSGLRKKGPCHRLLQVLRRDHLPDCRLMTGSGSPLVWLEQQIASLETMSSDDRLSRSLFEFAKLVELRTARSSRNRLAPRDQHGASP